MGAPSQPKVAIVIDSLNGGGAERVCLLLAKEFIKKGIEVHLILLKSRSDYEIPSFISVFSPKPSKRFSDRFRSQSSITSQISDYFRSQGGFIKVFVHLSDSYRTIASLQLPNAWYVLHNAVNATIQREKKLGPLKYWRTKKSYKVLNGKNVICVSKGVEQEVQTLPWLTPKNLCSIYNPIDHEGIVSAATEHNPNIPNKKYIIHVGRFAKQKRHDVLFSALRQLPEDIHLVLLCKPSKKLTRLIETFKIQHRVMVAGWQANPFNWIKHAACLALSSDYEGFGLVLAEALTLHTPVVSTDCPFGPNEILTGELRQFLVPCNNDTELAAAILRALASKETFQKAEMLSKLSAESVASAYLSLTE